MARHTQGPWRHACVDGRHIVATRDGMKIGEVEHEADASLIATLPKMLAALHAVRARIMGEWDHPALVAFGALGVQADDCLAIVNSAIAKAEGRS